MVLRVRAGDVEASRVGEDLRVAVGRGEHRRDQRPLRHARDRRPSCRAAPCVRSAGRAGRGATSRRPRSATGSGRARAARADRGVRVEQRDAVAEQVHRRLETCGEHETGGRLELAVVQSDAVVLRGDELAQQVIAGFGAQPLEVLRRASGRTAASAVSTVRNSRHDRPRSRLGAAAAPKPSTRWRSPAGTPRISAMTVTGSWVQYASTRSTSSAAVQLVQQLGGDLLGALAQLLDRADAEDAGDELAVAGVVRRFGDEQRRRLERAEHAGLGGPDEGPSQGAADLRGVEAGAEVVAGQHLAHDGQRGRDIGEAAPVERPVRADLLETGNGSPPRLAAMSRPCRSPRRAATRIAVRGMRCPSAQRTGGRAASRVRVRIWGGSVGIPRRYRWHGVSDIRRDARLRRGRGGRPHHRSGSPTRGRRSWRARLRRRTATECRVIRSAAARRRVTLASDPAGASDPQP